MQEFDVKRLETAIIYIERMSEGKNPATNQSVENEVLDNPNVIRCLHFVKEVLREVYSNHGVVSTRVRRSREAFPLEILEQFAYRHDKPVSQVLKQFEEPLSGDGRRYKKLNAGAVNKWLEANGYLVKGEAEPGKTGHWFPTAKGQEIGLYYENRGYDGREYTVIMYTKAAQEFLAAHMEMILSGVMEDPEIISLKDPERVIPEDLENVTPEDT